MNTRSLVTLALVTVLGAGAGAQAPKAAPPAVAQSAGATVIAVNGVRR